MSADDRTHYVGDGYASHPAHHGPCIRALDGDREPLGYCTDCYQDIDPTPCPECQLGDCDYCLGRVWDRDGYTDCPCAEAGHP